MNRESLPSDVYLKFHIKKGIEYGNVAPFRSTTIENMKNLNQPLILSAEGKEGLMVLYPDTIESLVTSTSTKIMGTNYSIVRIQWNPLPEPILKIMKEYHDMMYVMREEDGVKN